MSSILWDDEYEARKEGYDTRTWGQMEHWLPGGSFRKISPSNVSPERTQELITSLDQVIRETGFDLAEFKRLEQMRRDEAMRSIDRGEYDPLAGGSFEDRKQALLAPIGHAMFNRGYKLKELTMIWAGISGVGVDK